MHIGVDSLGLAGAYTAGVSLSGNANFSNTSTSNASLSNGPTLDLCCGSGIQVSCAHCI
jgi:methylase of polypeptide subunit release factors